MQPIKTKILSFLIINRYSFKFFEIPCIIEMYEENILIYLDLFHWSSCNGTNCSLNNMDRMGIDDNHLFCIEYLEHDSLIKYLDHDKT